MLRNKKNKRMDFSQRKVNETISYCEWLCSGFDGGVNFLKNVAKEECLKENYVFLSFLPKRKESIELQNYRDLGIDALMSEILRKRRSLTLI